ncbi:hypothetical protein PTSG_03425 [Salpingoeca rosetta]|uniref:SH2 domain-containing protein n=1 Tax=Salpingoeca rosetta (strain ATCC 50818 / BSB-021) TaxID=946362 RepID=F2U559_SALR5|nr:uncharacterized protein PTSG_03425 [Salpingoeca rosetta]EGD82775.1 hypothetical protein PTSG_03425 [Salpingoeca rosetta]|eukprot:XP_004996011.1 hypothetical protein PTSG_03425 [Salpingoeca rosetta]
MDENYIRLQDVAKRRQKVYEPIETADDQRHTSNSSRSTASAGGGRGGPPAGATARVAAQTQDTAPAPAPRAFLPTVTPSTQGDDEGEYDPTGTTKTVTSVQSLGDLTHHYTNMGALGCVIIKGVHGYCSFLNGIYRRVEDITYEDRHVYRLDTMVPHGNSVAAGKFLYMYFKAGQRAWAIGLRLGSSGVLAYRKVTGLDPVTGSGPWMVTDPQGNFFEEPSLRARMAGGYTVPYTEDTRLLERSSFPGALPYGFTRPKAEALLLQHFAQHRQGGVYVLRRSTSVADACILSILDAQGRCHHLQIDASKDGCHVCGTSIQRGSMAEVLETLTTRQLALVNGTRLPRLTSNLLDDRAFRELVRHTSSSSASRSTTLSRSNTMGGSTSSKGSASTSSRPSRTGSLQHRSGLAKQRVYSVPKGMALGAKSSLATSSSTASSLQHDMSPQPDTQ